MCMYIVYALLWPHAGVYVHVCFHEINELQLPPVSAATTALTPLKRVMYTVRIPPKAAKFLHILVYIFCLCNRLGMPLSLILRSDAHFCRMYVAE